MYYIELSRNIASPNLIPSLLNCRKTTWRTC